MPFFLYYLYHAVQAVNAVENLRYRIEGEQVYCYDRIHASATIGRADHTFAFSFIEQRDDLAEFVRGAQVEIAAVQASEGLRLSPATARPDVIHFSALPWVRLRASRTPAASRTPTAPPRFRWAKPTSRARPPSCRCR